ncbi:hypothetical protein ACSBR2_028256 [Camellia fascicularis]
MADLDHSTEDTSGDSRDDNNSHQGSELQFSEDEETLIITMFNLVGERWALIAGRIPGRTAEEIEKYWNSRENSIELFVDYEVKNMLFQREFHELFVDYKVKNMLFQREFPSEGIS